MLIYYHTLFDLSSILDNFSFKLVNFIKILDFLQKANRHKNISSYKAKVGQYSNILFTGMIFLKNVSLEYFILL